MLSSPPCCLGASSIQASWGGCHQMEASSTGPARQFTRKGCTPDTATLSHVAVFGTSEVKWLTNLDYFLRAVTPSHPCRICFLVSLPVCVRLSMHHRKLDRSKCCRRVSQSCESSQPKPFNPHPHKVGDVKP